MPSTAKNAASFLYFTDKELKVTSTVCVQMKAHFFLAINTYPIENLFSLWYNRRTNRLVQSADKWSYCDKVS